jgi:hypothetical protein
MEGLTQSSPLWEDLKAEHRGWLSRFPPKYGQNWENLLSADCEAALCEAAVRRLLQRRALAVQPNEDVMGSERRPDFRCTHSAGTFLVEATCIPIANVTEQTGLPHLPQLGARNYASLNGAFFRKILRKYAQYTAADHPVLLAVGLFHYTASALCINRQFANMLLTGETHIGWHVDTTTGRGVGDSFLTTRLETAAFLRAGQGGIWDVRTTLSGLLLCGFGFDPPNVLGLLHPSPLRPFDQRFLADIEFGRVQRDLARVRLSTTWSRASDDEVAGTG